MFIYNYTAKAQYDKNWNEITLQARGLILDAAMNVVAKPFAKFFNLDEHKTEEIPLLPFDVFEKIDGSLGILYWLNDYPYIATRGSFKSEQAKHANNLLYSQYKHVFDKFDKKATYLFEIIYPANRIVVDYAAMDDLIMLTIIDNHTGVERMEDIGFPMVKRYDGIDDLLQLKQREQENKEGFVIRFTNGLRIKIKFAEYVKLHKIITGVSNIAIWEYLAEGKSFEDLLEKVPDEFYNWVKQVQSEIVKEFNNIIAECKAVFKEFETRKETALYFQKQKYPSVLFSMLDGKTPDKIIWKMVRPKFSKPYKTGE